MDREDDDIKVLESVTFLDCSWTKLTDIDFQCSLGIIKAFSSTWEEKAFVESQNKCEKNQDDRSNSQCIQSDSERVKKPTNIFEIKENMNLSIWGLPTDIKLNYTKKGIKTMFAWQKECLSMTKVLHENGNLVYSAPTSAGKTLVAEILMVKTVLERKKRVIVVLPFVAVVREKTRYFQEICSESGIIAEGFMGGHTPPGGINSVHIAICTIEKANNLVNNLLQDGNISDIGALVIDELHLLADPHRGYILELLLTKIKYITKKYPDIIIQIIGMSAILPNLQILSDWLDADLYKTNFRPIELEEHCLISNTLYDSKFNKMKHLKNDESLKIDKDFMIHLCLETIAENCSVLIFCASKNSCEVLAQHISRTFEYLGYNDCSFGQVLRTQLDGAKIDLVLEQLKSCPVGLDSMLKSTISFGVAFHHAGLTLEERDIIEAGFKENVIRVLISTSTLSSGVNLPARRVIIKSPIFNSKPLDVLTYKQMIGRAGRMGIDTHGESILIALQKDKKLAIDLISGKIGDIYSCLDGEDRLMRAILEIVSSSYASTKDDVVLFLSCTLIQYNSSNEDLMDLAEKILMQLKEYELIRFPSTDNTRCVATPLGKACLSSSMSPIDGLTLFIELQKARECFVLETDLHIIYLVTPYSIANQWYKLDWLHYLKVWENLSTAKKRVGKLIGIEESFLSRCVINPHKVYEPELEKIHQIYKRFYTSLALQDLVNEVPLNEVAEKFNCSRGMLQSLQQSAATFSGMVTAFARELGWKNFEILVSQFHDRLYFGIQSDLLDLMKLKSLNGLRARAIFKAGLKSVCDVANANINIIENALNLAIPFESEKNRNGESKYDAQHRNALKNVWITGKKGISARDAALLLISEAREYLEKELGGINITWDKSNSSPIKISTSVCLDNSSKQISSLNNQPEDIHGKIDSIHSISSNASSLLPTNHESPKSCDSGNITNDSYLEHSLLENSVSTTNIFNNSDVDKSVNNSVNNSHLNCNKSADYSGEQRSDLSLFEDSLIVNTQLDNMLDNNILKCSLKNDHKNILSSASGQLSLERCFLKPFTLDESQNSLFTPSSSKNKNDILKEKSFLDCPIKRKFMEDEGSDNVRNYDVSPSKLNKTTVSSDKIENMYCYISISTLMIIKNLNAQIIDINEDDLIPIKLMYCTRNQDLFESFNIWIKKNKNISIHMDFTKKNKCSIENKIGGNILHSAANNLKNIEEHAGIGLRGIAFCAGDYDIFYVDVDAGKVASDICLENILNVLKMVFCDENCTFLMYDCKKVFNYLFNNTGIALHCQWEDLSIGEWFLSGKGTNEESSVKKIDSALNGFENITADSISSIKAWTIWHILTSIKKKMSATMSVSYAIEMKSLKVVSFCEINGLRVNKEKVTSIMNQLKFVMKSLEAYAYKLAGRTFKIYSSLEVAKVIGIYNGKKTRTNKKVLQKIENPLARVIVYWRKLHSILTKNIFPLLEKIRNNPNKDRIPISYNTFTATGRIIMEEPNLQLTPRNFSICLDDFNNFDVTEKKLKFSCREIVIADEDFCFVSADYCQLEFRLLAHLCEDKKLLKIINGGQDVFKLIISKWKNITIDEVNDELRQKAKMMSYGIIYGMGAKSLADNLAITLVEAEELMRTFYKMFPGIENYRKAVIKECREKGYVETLHGRKRYLPLIDSCESSEKLQAERQAFNTKIQGTAADVLKSAMISIDEYLKESCKNIRLILLMHDELLYEVPNTQMETFAMIFKNIMECAVNLSVSLPVKIKYGKTWGEMKDLHLDELF